jgi:hypothetical protein
MLVVQSMSSGSDAMMLVLEVCLLAELQNASTTNQQRRIIEKSSRTIAPNKKRLSLREELREHISISFL